MASKKTNTPASEDNKAKTASSKSSAAKAPKRASSKGSIDPKGGH